MIELSSCRPLAHQPAATTRRARAWAAAVTLAQPEGYVRVFADEGAPMAALLSRARAVARRPATRRLLTPSTRRTRPRHAPTGSASVWSSP